MEKVYQGKAKALYRTDTQGVLRMEFHDDATAFNGEKHALLSGKGKTNTQFTVLLFKYFEQEGIPTHFVNVLNSLNILVKEVQIIPLEVVVRNYVAGSLARRTGLQEGHKLSQPIVEFYYKNDALGDPLLTDAHIALLNLATPQELQNLSLKALKINELLIALFGDCGLTLVDFKIEFGRTIDPDPTLVLADEFSPDNCRLWDIETGEKMDKDRFRQDLGGVIEAYQEVLQRLEKKIST